MKIHCIGIGGIGVSALAQYYLAQGHEVSGSDLAPSEVTDFLQAKGVHFMKGNEAGHIKKGMDLVVHSPAVPRDNPEYIRAREWGIRLMSYPEALGELTKKYRTIAVAGSHGKSTTTAMTALALIAGGIDPTVIVGTKLKEFGGSNFRMGKGEWLVIEACEYDGSFLHYDPQIIVLTNVDQEHMDYFKTFSNEIRIFRQFIMRLPTDGRLVLNGDDLNSKKAISKKTPLIRYSLRQKEAIKLQKSLKIPGRNNVSNALAAMQAARLLKIKDAPIFKALAAYQGSWRRFEVKKGRVGHGAVTVVSDYGHHPTEILATLKAARQKYPKKQIWCIFQPHQHQRTHYLFKDFVNVLRQAPVDRIMVADIYDVAGRETEKINASVSSQKLVAAVKKKSVTYMTLPDAVKCSKESLPANNVLIIMGAGDVYKLADAF